MITLTYLGSAGWHFRSEAGGLLVDPFLTRPPLRHVLSGKPLIPAEDRIVHLIGVHDLAARGILVTHPHFDHIMDVPTFARVTGAWVGASVQATDLLDDLGVHRLSPMKAGDALQVGDYVVEVFPSRHRQVAGRVPFTGPLPTPLTPPLPASAYRMQEQFSFMITVGGLRILLLSGIDEEPQLPADVLICGADMRSKRLTAVLEAVQPQLVLPNHWDDYFRPLGQPPRPMRLPRLPLMRINMHAFTERVRSAGTPVHVLGHFESVRI